MDFLVQLLLLSISGCFFVAAITKAVYAKAFKNDVNLWDKYATECLICFACSIVTFISKWII